MSEMMTRRMRIKKGVWMRRSEGQVATGCSSSSSKEGQGTESWRHVGLS
jgi:hypothetical protein